MQAYLIYAIKGRRLFITFLHKWTLRCYLSNQAASLTVEQLGCRLGRLVGQSLSDITFKIDCACGECYRGASGLDRIHNF